VKKYRENTHTCAQQNTHTCAQQNTTDDNNTKQVNLSPISGFKIQ